MYPHPRTSPSLPFSYNRSVMQVTVGGSRWAMGRRGGDVGLSGCGRSSDRSGRTRSLPFLKPQRSPAVGARRRRISALVVVVCIGLLSHALAVRDARVAEPRLAARIDSLFSVVGPSAPGAAVMVLKGGRAVFERGYGVTDLRTLHKIDEHTNFRIASLSKQFTAMAIMLLVHDGKLRYDEPLTEIFPEFPAYGRGITIRHLLNHTSGLLDYEDLMAQEYGSTPDEQIPQIQTAQVLTRMEKANTTKFPPGSQWAYSNSGYCVLAMVLEKVSGQSFRDLMWDRIFAPLQMEHTLAYENGKNEVPNRAYGHTPQGGAGARPTRIRPRRRWAMEACTRRCRTSHGGMVHCRTTRCSPKTR